MCKLDPMTVVGVSQTTAQLPLAQMVFLCLQEMGGILPGLCASATTLPPLREADTNRAGVHRAPDLLPGSVGVPQ